LLRRENTTCIITKSSKSKGPIWCQKSIIVEFCCGSTRLFGGPLVFTVFAKSLYAVQHRVNLTSPQSQSIDAGSASNTESLLSRHSCLHLVTARGRLLGAIIQRSLNSEIGLPQISGAKWLTQTLPCRPPISPYSDSIYLNRNNLSTYPTCNFA
jgi:hypothetical protein